DLSAANSTPTALKLQPLALNSPGTTQTIALGAGSTAVDVGDPTAPAVDQRGVTRPQGAGFDIGGFERVPGVPTAGATGHNVTSSAEPVTYQFTVTYTDDTAMLYSSINGNNTAVTVTGTLTAGGTVNPAVTFVSATPTSNATSITATYQITAPGGTWDGADNGAYTINMVANQ